MLLNLSLRFRDDPLFGAVPFSSIAGTLDAVVIAENTRIIRPRRLYMASYTYGVKSYENSLDWSNKS